MQRGQEVVKVFRLAVVGARMRAGMTQPDLAAATGLSRAHIAMIETGARRPSYVALAAIATATGVKPSDLAILRSLGR